MPPSEAVHGRFLGSSGTRHNLGHRLRSLRAAPPRPSSLLLSSLHPPLALIWFVITLPFRFLVVAGELMGAPGRYISRLYAHGSWHGPLGGTSVHLWYPTVHRWVAANASILGLSETLL